MGYYARNADGCDAGSQFVEPKAGADLEPGLRFLRADNAMTILALKTIKGWIWYDR
jgi:hypothetical protein